jgi:hypothetical protein
MRTETRIRPIQATLQIVLVIVLVLMAIDYLS